jgi:Mn2+/Fe2+ NRAMP family transporter
LTPTTRWLFDEPRQPAFRKLLQALGPGLIAGASDDDPSGIATYSQIEAQFGYGLAWTLVFSYPLMAAIQEINARIGRVTGFGLPLRAKAFYAAIAAGMVLGAALNFSAVDPIRALYWSAVLNGVAVPMMVMMMRLTMRRSIMAGFTLPLPLQVMGCGWPPQRRQPTPLGHAQRGTAVRRGRTALRRR